MPAKSDLEQSSEGSLLAQQEILLREADHRVKNSLQLISSLLRMQAARYATMPVLVEELVRASCRIEAVARAHERLHRAERHGKVHLADYLRDFCTDLAISSPASIELDATAAIFMPARKAILVGLVAAELVTNACKHGYRDGVPMRIRVGLAVMGDNTLRLSVEDDGNGLPDGFDPARSDGFGMRLICHLVQALGARLEASRTAPGTKVAVLLSCTAPGEDRPAT